MQLDTVAPLLDTVQLISLQFDQKTETLAFPRGRGSEAEDAKLCALGERPGLTFPPETFPRLSSVLREAEFRPLALGLELRFLEVMFHLAG